MGRFDPAHASAAAHRSHNSQLGTRLAEESDQTNEHPDSQSQVPLLHSSKVNFIMQRSTLYLTQRAQELAAMLPCDDEEGSKNKTPLAFYLKHAWRRKTNLGTLLFGLTFVMIYMCGFMSSSVHSVRLGAKVSIATAPTTIQPLVCHDFLRQVKYGSYRIPLNVHDPHHKKEGYRVTVRDPNLRTGILRRRTTTEFPFTISLHHEEYDKSRWNIYKHGQYFQHAKETIWTDILKEASPGAHIIDIGYVIMFAVCYVALFGILHTLVLRRVSCYIDGRGNRPYPSLPLSHPTNNFPLVLLQYNSGLIGYYALLSAAMGEFNIDVFEPNLKNNIRTCESVTINKWQNEWEQEASNVPREVGSPVVNIWNAGVSDMPGTFKFFEGHGNNPAGGRFGGFGNNRTDYAELPVTALDTFAEERSWFESLPEIAILQIDVEQDNSKVLVGAQKLLKSGIVQNIFTEVSMKDPAMISKEKAAHELLVQAGYKVKGQGGWVGPGKDSLWPDDANLVENIFNYLKVKNKESLTLWWGLD
jgi:hypothetical protein